MSTPSQKPESWHWKWGEQASRAKPDAYDRRNASERFREPSRLEQSARMRSARLLEPSHRRARSF